ncbi:uncharacterized protein PpBr36_10296 [Pyricularia pennisetigena]|uniref:uncharacterized protein n=1 Tax=Pyricularia pennisetigena TaxID=1578925 RepID=UPI00114EACBC|nr:uncharacterized protein PpBr36_10296 [Pyricularia pennisetigena]TLS21563.1 hypothetical protein PpBr36_10296 [Pyricularia pennisetigena]
MHFSKIQLFALLAAVSASAGNVGPVDSLSLPLTEAVTPIAPVKPAAPADAADIVNVTAPVSNITPSYNISLGLFGSESKSEKGTTLARRITIKNCEARTSKIECGKIFSGCTWLRASQDCVKR